MLKNGLLNFKCAWHQPLAAGMVSANSPLGKRGHLFSLAHSQKALWPASLCLVLPPQLGCVVFTKFLLLLFDVRVFQVHKCVWVGVGTMGRKSSTPLKYVVEIIQTGCRRGETVTHTETGWKSWKTGGALKTDDSMWNCGGTSSDYYYYCCCYHSNLLSWCSLFADDSPDFSMTQTK